MYALKLRYLLGFGAQKSNQKIVYVEHRSKLWAAQDDALCSIKTSKLCSLLAHCRAIWVDRG